MNFKKHVLYISITMLTAVCISSSSFAQSSSTDSLKNLVNSLPSDTSKISALIKLSLSYVQTYPDSALYFAKEAESLSTDFPNSLLRAKVFVHLGRVSIRKSDFEKGLNYFSKALGILEELPNQINLMAQTLRGMGNIYFIQYKYDESEAFYNDALQYFQTSGDSNGVARVYGNFANIYYETQRLDEALIFYRKQLPIFLETDTEMDEGATFLNMGMLFESIDSLDQATLFSEKALDIAERNNALVMKTYPLKVLSTVSRGKKDYSKALTYAQESLDLATELGILYEQKDAHLNLSDSYEGLGQFEHALHHYRAHKELNDTLLNEDANARLAEMRVKYESEKKEQEIVALETENELQKARIASVTSSLGLILLTCIGGILWFASKKKKEVELLEKDKIIGEAKNKLAQEELQNLKLKEQNLRTELTNYALHIVEKNDFLSQVKSEIAQIRKEVKSEEAIKHINQLGSKVYQNVMLNKDREEFELQVDQACEGFYRNLDRKYPELTTQERRLAALLRLNLSSKEISGILNISPKSVDQSRYRLRKKLPMASKNFSVFLNQI